MFAPWRSHNPVRITKCPITGKSFINVTTEGHKHLGTVLGSRSFLEEYVGEKVDEWVNKVAKPADFAISQPQACYAAFSFGLRHCWSDEVTGYCRITLATRARD